MAISKKPISKKISNSFTDSIINKGGSSPNDVSNIIIDTNESIKITIRLPSKMLNIIDDYLKNSISKKTRTSWLREAAEDKIKKDIT